MPCTVSVVGVAQTQVCTDAQADELHSDKDRVQPSLASLQGAGEADLNKRPDVGCWNHVFMGNAIVDDPDGLCLQRLSQLEVLKHSQACITALPHAEALLIEWQLHVDAQSSCMTKG